MLVISGQIGLKTVPIFSLIPLFFLLIHSFIDKLLRQFQKSLSVALKIDFDAHTRLIIN